MNNQPVTDTKTLQQSLDETGVGSKLHLQLRRNGRDAALTIKPD